MPDVSLMIERAAAAYSAGLWPQAEELCRQILALDVADYDALELLGIIAAQSGRTGEGVELLRQAAAVRPLDLQAHFNYGNVLHMLGRTESALQSFERALEIDPHFAGAHVNRGNVLRDLGRPEEALESCERAISLQPDCAQAFSNRSAILIALKQSETALTSADRAIALKPDLGQAHLYRAIALAELKQPLAAVASIDRAIELMPDDASAHFNRGLIMRNRDEEAALRSFGKALDCDPGLTKAYENLGWLLVSTGRSDEAAGVYRKWLEVEPANPIAQHMYAATSEHNVPERCAVGYVTALFDDFASSFDTTLEGIGYAAPQLLIAALARRVALGQGRLDILDAGCGTGLCGVLLRPTARVLAGVDLSSQMLAKARARNVYDELFEAELGAFMESRPQQFDVVNCADTFVYIGALQWVISAARRCLRPRGVLAFTVEALPEEGTPSHFKLTIHGRYAHSRTYIQEIMAVAGFSEVECQCIDLRKEVRADVRGYLFMGSVAE